MKLHRKFIMITDVKGTHKLERAQSLQIDIRFYFTKSVHSKCVSYLVPT
jgi:hypothetical protein